MRMLPRGLLGGSALLILDGCASLPPRAAIYYYDTTTQINVSVTRTVACDHANHILVSSAVTLGPVNLADTSKVHEFDLDAMSGALSDSDAKFTLSEDGRLLGVNATTTGQGGTVLTDLGSMAVLSTARSTGNLPSRKHTFAHACTALEQAVGDGKPLTITYDGLLKNIKAGKSFEVPPSNGGAAYADELKSAIGTVLLKVESVMTPPAPFHCTENARDTLPAWCRAESGGQNSTQVIYAQQPAQVVLSISSQDGEATDGNAKFWQGSVPVAQLGIPYVIPMPRAAVFGSMTLALVFSDSGALTSIQFVSHTGTGQVTDAANQIFAKEQDETAAKAAEVKAQADLIAQQQRLMMCKISSANCKP